MRPGSRAGWAGIAVFVLAAGCASNVPVVLGFPSEEAALVSSNATIALIPVTAADLTRCPALLGAASFDEGIIVDSIPVCDLRSYSLPDPGGAAAIVVRVQDDRNTVILEGCTVADVFPGRAPIDIDLYPTEAFAATLMRSRPPPGTTLSTRCGGS